MQYKTMVVGPKGTPEELKVVQKELVEPADDEVRIKMFNTGVSFGNLLMQDQASKKPRADKPVILGYEIVGEIDAVGAMVSEFAAGERVVAYTGGRGGYTQYAYRKPADLVRLPPGADPAQAVCLILNYMTAYECLHRQARVKPGDTILITGASGGVGSALLDLGRLAGLKMYGTASTAKHALLVEKGAVPIDYKTQDFVEFIQSRHPQGIDYAIDSVGGGNELRCLKVVKKGGRVISYGARSINASGSFKMVPILSGFVRFMLAGLLPNGKKTGMYFIGSYKRSHPQEFKEDLQTLLQLLVDHKIEPVIGARLPLTQAYEAHRLLLEGSVTGKIVLDCQEPPAV